MRRASVAFREPERPDATFRLLVLEGGEIAARADIAFPTAIPARAAPPPSHLRQAGMDPARYDRLRVLATELARVRAEGGEVAIRIGARLIDEPRVGLLVR